jgi:hypothetical protein
VAVMVYELPIHVKSVDFSARAIVGRAVVIAFLSHTISGFLSVAKKKKSDTYHQLHPIAMQQRNLRQEDR